MREVFLAFVNGYWLSIATPLASVVPLTVGFAAARSIVERRAGVKIAAERSTLARFQSPLLLDQLQREPDFLEKPVRQDVAVMFVDLSGSTGVSEALGPEWTRDLFGAMQTLVEGEVTAHGGVVINYMGDGVLAVFGLPKPRSDDAARALATVEALHESMTAWLANLPLSARERLDFRIGLHFGPAILSRLGSPTQQQITATGDTVNVASRLLEVAKQQHCRIVVTEDLFQAASATAPMANIDSVLYAPLTVSIRGRASDLPVRIRTLTASISGREQAGSRGGVLWLAPAPQADEAEAGETGCHHRPGRGLGDGRPVEIDRYVAIAAVDA